MSPDDDHKINSKPFLSWFRSIVIASRDWLIASSNRQFKSTLKYKYNSSVRQLQQKYNPNFFFSSLRKQKICKNQLRTEMCTGQKHCCSDNDTIIIIIYSSYSTPFIHRLLIQICHRPWNHRHRSIQLVVKRKRTWRMIQKEFQQQLKDIIVMPPSSLVGHHPWFENIFSYLF